MQDIFGEELKKILQNSKIQVPKAYDKRIEETLSNISAKETIFAFFFIRRQQL